MLSGTFFACASELCKSCSLRVTRDEFLQYGASRPGSAAEVEPVICEDCSRLGDRTNMSSADIAACFPSEHDSLLGTDVESRRRSSKPFYLTRSSLETREKAQGGLAGWWARFGEGGTIFDAFLMDQTDAEADRARP